MSYKVPQLYLWGDSNTGKNTFIERLVGVNLPHGFYPGDGKFS